MEFLDSGNPSSSGTIDGVIAIVVLSKGALIILNVINEVKRSVGVEKSRQK
jgi:hypothetical protein